MFYIELASPFFMVYFQVWNYIRLSSNSNTALTATHKFIMQHTNNGITYELGICQPGPFRGVRVDNPPSCSELI